MGGEHTPERSEKHVREVTGTCRFQLGTNGIASNSFEGTADSFGVAGKLDRGSISKELTLSTNGCPDQGTKESTDQSENEKYLPKGKDCHGTIFFFSSPAAPENAAARMSTSPILERQTIPKINPVSLILSRMSPLRM